MPIARSLSHLGWLDLDSAVTGPGIYAWYSAPLFGDSDAQDEDGVRLTLSRHSEHYLPPPLRVEARSRFWDEWTGRLAARDVVADQGPTPEALQRCLAAEVSRERLIRLLDDAQTILQSPLYIGIGLNLRQRLVSHKRAYHRLEHESTENRRILASEPHGGDATRFAERVLVCGFRPDELSVWCLDLELALGVKLGKTKSTQDLLETVEWYMNRWARPMLGRK